MNTEQERTEFEAWYEREYSEAMPCGYSPHGYYLDARIQLLFRCWQAGRDVLQSRDREDAERYRHLVAKLQQAHDGEHFESECFSVRCRMSNQQKGSRAILAEISWRDNPGEPIGLSEAIDHARRAEGDGDVI